MDPSLKFPSLIVPLNEFGDTTLKIVEDAYLSLGTYYDSSRDTLRGYMNSIDSNHAKLLNFCRQFSDQIKEFIKKNSK